LVLNLLSPAIKPLSSETDLIVEAIGYPIFGRVIANRGQEPWQQKGSKSKKASPARSVAMPGD